MNKQSRRKSNRKSGLQNSGLSNVSSNQVPKSSVNAIRAAIATASVIGAGFAGQAAADTFSLDGGNKFNNSSKNLSGTFNDNFFRPGKTSNLAGSAGFFDAKGSTQAVQIVQGTHQYTPNWYNAAKVNLGATGDATNLQNMKESLKIIRETNHIRTDSQYGENQPALQVSDVLMASSQIKTDWTANHSGHSPGGGVTWAAGENLGYGISATDVSYAWFSEKERCAGKNRQNCTWSGSTGHYLNMVGDSTTAGAAINSAGTYVTEGAYAGDNIFPTNNYYDLIPLDKTDLDRYEAQLDAYIDTGFYFYNEGNTVDVNGNIGTDSRVAGGYAWYKQDSATNNTVNVNKSATAGTVYGGYTTGGNTSNNIVNVYGNVGTVYGGYSENASATHSDNTINIISGKADNVYLGNGAANSGTVNFLGGSVVELKAVKGNGKANNAVLNLGAKGKDDANRTAMNTLKASGEVGGFNEYNFYLPSSVKAGDTALSADKATLGNAAVNVFVPGDTNLKSSESMHLIATNNGVSWNGKAQVHQGVTLKTDFGAVGVSGKNLDLSLNGAGSSTSTPTPSAPASEAPATEGSSSSNGNNQQASTANGSSSAPATSAPANNGSSSGSEGNQQASTGNGSANGSSSTTTPANNGSTSGSGNNQQASTGSSSGSSTPAAGSSGGEVCTGLACLFRPKPKPQQDTEQQASNGSNGSSSTTTTGGNQQAGNDSNGSSGTTTAGGNQQAGNDSNGSSSTTTTGGNQQVEANVDKSIFNISSNNSFANAGSSNNQAFNNVFTAAENTDNATINILANKDYKGVDIYGSKKGNSTININDAQNLGKIDTHASAAGNQTLTMTNSSSGAIKIDGKKGKATITNSTIDSFWSNNNSDGTGEFTFNHTTVNGNVEAENDKSLSITNNSKTGNVIANNTASVNIANSTTGDVFANSSKNFTIADSTVGNIVQNGGKQEASGKNIKITNSQAATLQIDTGLDSKVVIQNSQFDKYQSTYGNNSSSISFDNTKVSDISTIGENLDIANSTVSGNINSTGQANKLNISSSLVGNIVGNSSDASKQEVVVKDSIISDNLSSHKVKLSNTSVGGTVSGSIVDIDLASDKRVEEVVINKGGEEASKITGVGVISSINAENATSKLNITPSKQGQISGISVVSGITGNSKATLAIDAQNASLNAGSVNGFGKVEFSNLATDHSALQLTGAANTSHFANVSVDDLDKYNDGKKYKLVSSNNKFTVADSVLNQNIAGNDFHILSGTEYAVNEFGYHQNDAKTELYLNSENVTKQIENKHFSVASDSVKAVIDIDKAADYAGLNITGNSSTTINYSAGVNLGVIDGRGGVLNVGTAKNPLVESTLREAENIKNLSALNFYLPADIYNGQRFLELTSSEKTDLTNTAITAYLSGDKKINDGDIVQLITKRAPGGEIEIGKNNKVAKVQQGITLTTTGQTIQLSEQKDALELVFSKENKPTNNDNNQQASGGNNGSASTGNGSSSVPATSAPANVGSASGNGNNQQASTGSSSSSTPATSAPANNGNKPVASGNQQTQQQPVQAQQQQPVQAQQQQPVQAQQQPAQAQQQPAQAQQQQPVQAQQQQPVQAVAQPAQTITAAEQKFDASVFEILSSTSVQEGEDQATETKKIQGNLFPLSGKNQTVNIAKNVDYEGLNIQGNNTATINFLDGYNLGVIDGAQTLNIGLEDKPTAMNARTAKNIKNVANLNFYLPSDIQNNDVALSLSSSEKTDLSNVGVTAYISGDSNISDQDRVHLINKPNGGEISIGANKTATVQQGITLSSIGQEIVLADDKLNLDLVFHQENNPSSNGRVTTTVNEKTKSLVQAKIAAPALINQSSENLAGSLDDLYSSTQMNRNSIGGQAFANVSAADQKITTGSHIDMKGANVNVGYAQNIQSDAGTTLAGVFAEYSYADYDTYLDDSTHGNGDVKAYGVGVFANHTFDSGFYVQGSVKGGKTKTNYSSNDFVHSFGNGVSYKTDSSYFAGSVGAGQIVDLGQNDNLDIYGKYMYTYVGSDDAKLSSGETYHFDSVKSNRLRAGVRYNHNSSENVKFFAGAAYEYEMNGKANAEYQGYRLPTPSIKGSTAIGEVGIAVKSGKTQFETSLQGFGGKRKGAMLKFGVRF
ncbi:MAG: hypothetical protein IJ566_06650 [Cardiobacteriaceae bacterium]|nr:hypothetical protein [Cardiobacteriaceae bacterium]